MKIMNTQPRLTGRKERQKKKKKEIVYPVKH